jgi:hypothetical protein
LEDILVAHGRTTIVEAFQTSHHAIPYGVKFIVPISNLRLKNAPLAISRRISQLGYADRVNPDTIEEIDLDTYMMIRTNILLRTRTA